MTSIEVKIITNSGEELSLFVKKDIAYMSDALQYKDYIESAIEACENDINEESDKYLESVKRQ